MKFFESEKSGVIDASPGGGIGTTLSGEGGMEERTFEGMIATPLTETAEAQQTLARPFAQIGTSR
jgi:hypothetical protein